MSAFTRRKRPEPERSAPQRAFAEWAKGIGAQPAERATTEAEPKPASTGEPPRAADRTVNGAYRLIDEYLRQGQKAAEDVWLPTDGKERTDEKLDIPVRFMRAMGDMTMAWIELMQEWTAAPAESPGSAGPFTAGRAPTAVATGEPTPQRPLRLSVKATEPVEVTLNLQDASGLSTLVASELRCYTGDGAAISDVKLESTEDGPILRISVPAAQPPGTYNGLLMEPVSLRPRGTITVVVG